MHLRRKWIVTLLLFPGGLAVSETSNGPELHCDGQCGLKQPLRLPGSIWCDTTQTKGCNSFWYYGWRLSSRGEWLEFRSDFNVLYQPSLFSSQRSVNYGYTMLVVIIKKVYSFQGEARIPEIKKTVKFGMHYFLLFVLHVWIIMHKYIWALTMLPWEENAFCLKGVFYWASNPVISVDKRVFFLPKSAEKGCFFKLGCEHSIRFGRERGVGAKAN